MLVPPESESDSSSSSSDEETDEETDDESSQPIQLNVFESEQMKAALALVKGGDVSEQTTNQDSHSLVEEMDE